MSVMHQYRISGPTLALLAAALFGASTPFAKLLLGTGTDPWLLAGLLYAGSGCGLMTAYVAGKGRRSEAPLRSSELPWLLWVILSGGIVAPVLLMFGLATTSAASASLLLNLEALATMSIAWMIFKESVDRRLLLGALAILLGAIVLTYRGAAGFGWGSMAIAAACIAWGIDNNLTRKLSAGDPIQIAALKGLCAAVVNLVLASWHGAIWPNAGFIVAAMVIGLFGYGLSLALFVVALRQLGSARTGAYFSTAPFIGSVGALWLLHETLTEQLIIAAVLMGIGVYLHLTERHEHEHMHQGMEHEHRHIHDEHHQHSHGRNDPSGEPHSHWHRHEPLMHSHPHYPDIHHRHLH